MAHHEEPMDIDSDFDNKENSLHYNNVLPFTEKGYEEVDVSDLNMKLRYSVTPVASPMSKSYTANCLDNRSSETGDEALNVNENANLTRSLYSALNKNDIGKSRVLPLQTITSEHDRTSVLRPLDSTVPDSNNIGFIVSTPNDDENLSLPSSSSSTAHTPEATTPTKEPPKSDGGSPIMRGLKSVLNMFRSSQSPIPTEERVKPEILSPSNVNDKVEVPPVVASTPIAAHRKKEPSPSKINSPKEYKDSVVFNEDLEKELQWKDETTILFSQERIPIHKLFLQQPLEKVNKIDDVKDTQLDTTVEYMDISQNDSIRDQTITDIYMDVNSTLGTLAVESDSEFVDCETTITKNDQEFEDKDETPVNTQEMEVLVTNNSGSRLKPIILNTTQDILDATLSITPEDLLQEVVNDSDSVNTIVEEHLKTSFNTTEANKTVCLENLMTNLEELKNLTEEVTSIPIDKELVANVPENITSTKHMTTNEPKLEQTIEPTLDDTHKIENPQNKQQFNITIECTDPEIVVDTSKEVNNTPANETVTVIRTSMDLEDNKVLDEAITIECISTNQPSLNETINIETEQSINDTKTFETTAMQAIDTTIEINRTLDNMDRIFLDSTTINQNYDLNMSVPLDPENNLIETVEHNIQNHNTIKTQGAQLENSQEINKVEVANEEIISVLKTELNLGFTSDVHCNNTDPINNLEPDAIDMPSNFVNEIATPELPVDIPLPDDDNSDDCSLPHDLAHNIKTALNEDGLNCIKDKRMFESEVFPDNAIFEKIIYDLSNEIDNYKELPEVVPSFNMVDVNNVCVHETENTTVLPNVLNEVSITQESSDPEVSDKDPFAMNIEETNCGMTSLPDIVNQTIYTNTEQTLNQNTIDVTSIEQNISKQASETLTNAIDHKVNNTFNVETADATKKVEEFVSSDLTKESCVVTDKDVTTTDMDQKLSLEENLSTNVTNTEEKELQEKTITDQLTHNVNVELEFNLQPIEVKESLVIPTPVEIQSQDEEIIVSENNSPFVSVGPEVSPLKENDVRDISDSPKTRVLNTPPSSPPIASKGYNFNFDEMDDPFDTKSKVSLSPQLENLDSVFESKPHVSTSDKIMTKKEINNRRKSQSARRKSLASKKNINSSFDTTVNHEKLRHDEVETNKDTTLQQLAPEDIDINNGTIEEGQNMAPITKEILTLEPNNEELIEEPSLDVNLDKDLKKEMITPSSSEQSTTYYSAGSSSVASITSRNVFNLPEIDDINFNPFATKSNVCLSPPASLNIENPFETRSKMKNSLDIPFDLQDEAMDIDKIETEAMEKDVLANLSNNTTSSKATDEKDHTVKEINTEDEDTVEGPFLEAEDVIGDERLSDCDSESNMIQFKVPFHQTAEDQVDSGELFIDAEAFEFLLNQNKSNTVVDSGKESLFLKFDPLFAKRMSAVTSDGVVAALSKLKRQSTPTKLAAATSPNKSITSPVPGPSNLNITQDLDLNSTEEFNDLNVTVSKPMMVVPPAVNPVTPRNKSLTPNKSNRRSITFTSPAMAVIDRLLSLSGNSPHIHDSTVTQERREHNEADLVLSQLRELLAEKEISVYNLRSESRELQDRLCSMESQVKSLEAESQERLKKINNLNDKLAEKTKINKNMAAVVEGCERTIASLISETAQDKKRNAEERMRLISERDEQTAHLASMEVSFSDLHSKYEKSKQVILHCKANEDTYKKSIKDFEENLAKMQTNYELLKQHATSKLNHANQELEKINKTHEAEVLKLNAMIKRKELHITSLEETLTQKTKANEELTAICDELINKVG